MQRITPFLWYNGRIQEAIDLYCAVFPDSRILSRSLAPPRLPGDPDPARAQAALNTMLQMQKIDAALECTVPAAAAAPRA